MSDIRIVKSKEILSISSLRQNSIHKLYIHISENALGVPWRVPAIVVRGTGRDPVLGITAAVHGNELNGTSTIFKLIKKIDPSKLKGTLVLIPISNLPGYLLKQRHFIDQVDLNRIMPGKETGGSSYLYALNFISKVVSKFDYLLDLHTASQGKTNTLYIRADLENEVCKKMALLQNPRIIVQKYDEHGTLRSWANENHIPAITIEIGNPNQFQHNLIDETLVGITNLMKDLKMISGKVKRQGPPVIVCDRSFWIFSKRGGILDVSVKLNDRIKKGQQVARIFNVFGEVVETVEAKDSGVVIGKNIQPCCHAGERIIHLGIDIQKNSKDK